MKPKILFLLLPLIAWAACVSAEDIDIYGVAGSGNIKPNVLIVLDNSGSMSSRDVGPAYNHAENYLPEGLQEDLKHRIYREEEEGNKKVWRLYFHNINSSNWKDSKSQSKLLQNGIRKTRLQRVGEWYNGTVTSSSTGSKYRFATLNYFYYRGYIDGGQTPTRHRMAVAKEAVANLIAENYEKVRFGLMRFNYDGAGGYLEEPCGATRAALIGDYIPGTSEMTKKYQDSYGAVGKLYPHPSTPLAETMAEAGLYFAGKNSWFNEEIPACMPYNSPIEHICQKNYVILVTDGYPYKDDKKFEDKDFFGYKPLVDSHDDEKSSRTCNSESCTDYYDRHYRLLDDVVDVLRHTDILPSMGGAGNFQDQTITTHTIGFKKKLPLLQLSAQRGGGNYYEASNSSELGDALQSIVDTIEEEKQIFTAAAVPVDRANKAYAGNFVYYGLFQPTNEGNWYGNIKKYGISNKGKLLDAKGYLIEAGGSIIGNAQSYWSSGVDGADVTKGGAGEKLKNREGARNLYTLLGSNTNLTAVENAFALLDENGNPDKDGTVVPKNLSNLGFDKTKIEAVHNGVDDDWPLASFLHSQPIVVYYDTDNDGTDDHSMIYAGSNGGMMHCFDDNDGTEKWGFIPPNLLPKILSSYLQPENPNKREYFVDATPAYYHYQGYKSDGTEVDKKLLVFGERRGGKSYTALDISDFETPLYAYNIPENILGSETLGQSWSIPQPLQMATSEDSTTDVFLMTGGYDENQDKFDNPAPDSEDLMGRAVFAVYAKSGALFNNFLFNHNNYSAMTHSIIAAAGFENPKSRITTRVYAGDMGGNLFAFRDDIFHWNKDPSFKVKVAGSDPEGVKRYDGMEDGDWEQKLKLFSVPGRKIWYAPNVVNEFFPVDITYVASEGAGNGASGADDNNASGDDDNNAGGNNSSNNVDVTRSEKRVGEYVFFGTGDRAHPNRKDLHNGFYAIKNNWQWNSDSPSLIEAKVRDDGKVVDGSGKKVVDLTQELPEATGLYIVDLTENLFQDGDQTLTNYVKKAMNHKSNRGWFIRLKEHDKGYIGEKVVSSPLIFNGVVYFSTYIPDEESSNLDPCASSGAKGTGYLYAIGYKYGEAVINFDEEEPGDPVVLDRSDRRKAFKNKGIPPQPILVVHDEKPTIISGFETFDPPAPIGLERAFWRQLNN